MSDLLGIGRAQPGLDVADAARARRWPRSRACGGPAGGSGSGTPPSPPGPAPAAARSATSATAPASAALEVNGFSHRTCLPGLEGGAGSTRRGGCWAAGCRRRRCRGRRPRPGSQSATRGIPVPVGEGDRPGPGPGRPTTSTVASAMGAGRPDECGRGDPGGTEDAESDRWRDGMAPTVADRLRPYPRHAAGPLMRSGRRSPEGACLQGAVDAGRRPGRTASAARCRPGARFRMPTAARMPADDAPGGGDDHRPLEPVGQRVGVRGS